jgi:hypothetical protein
MILDLVPALVVVVPAAEITVTTPEEVAHPIRANHNRINIGFAVGKSRAMEDIQELHDGKNDEVDENGEGECGSTDKDFCSGLFDGWHKTILEGTTPDQRLD